MKEFRKLRETFFPKQFLSDQDYWQIFIVARCLCKKSTLHYCSAPFCLRQVHQTVNKMCCKYVILLIIYTQKTITLQRQIAVVCIKDRRHTSGKHKYAILLLLSLCLWFYLSLGREKERTGYLNSLESTPPALFLPPPTQSFFWSVHISDEMYKKTT